jgi:hypothetical protein
MGRERQAGQGGRSQGEAEGASALAQLEKRFAQFRSKHPRGTRYPDELRQAVLGLLGEVAPDALYRACGVSFRQVMAWRAALSASPAKEAETEATKVRVFSVVDEQPAPGIEPQAAGPELELQVGPWSVSVRLTWRGGTCCP